MDTALNLRDIKKVSLNELLTLKLTNQEVYSREEDIRVRLSALDKAFTFSRSDLYKTLLVISTDAGFRAIQTKIISLNLDHIIVEGNYQIPIPCIYSVNIE